MCAFAGRPLSIFDRDFDSTLPAEDSKEEMTLWTRVASPCAGGDIPDTELPSLYMPVPCRPIASFNACARLCESPYPTSVTLTSLLVLLIFHFVFFQPVY